MDEAVSLDEPSKTVNPPGASLALGLAEDE